MSVVEVNREAKDVEEWRLEWTTVGKSCGRNDEEAEEKTEFHETDDDTGDDFVGGVQLERG